MVNILLWFILVISYDKISTWHLKNHSNRLVQKKTTPMPAGVAQIQVPYPKAARRNALEILNKILQNLGRGQKKKRVESIYEPYWIDGEWVYYRTTQVLRKKITKPTSSTTPWSSTQTTTRRGPTSSPTTPWVNYMCQHPCLGIYEDYGLVCGKRFNGWEYEMKQFDDTCDLINENCINPATRPRNRWAWYRGPWYVAYRGPCWELTTTWVYPPTNVTALIIRNLKYVSNVDYHKENSIYPN